MPLCWWARAVTKCFLRGLYRLTVSTKLLSGCHCSLLIFSSQLLSLGSQETALLVSLKPFFCGSVRPVPTACCSRAEFFLVSFQCQVALAADGCTDSKEFSKGDAAQGVQRGVRTADTSLNNSNSILIAVFFCECVAFTDLLSAAATSCGGVFLLG